MKKIRFFKYHGLGNDFLVVDLIGKSQRQIDFNDLALKICDRNLGVGADGIIILTGSKKADCSFDLFNSDGSWAEKSGNGLRCAAAYYYTIHSHKKNISFELGGEISKVKVTKAQRDFFMMQVMLGKPEFKAKKIPMKSISKFHINQSIVIDGRKFPVTSLSVGNPHTVMFVDNFDFDWRELGSIIEISKTYPNRTNVEFVKIVSRKKVILNDWERGAGANGSSGTGAAAAVVAGVVNGLLDRQVEVVFPSGSLFIEWDEQSDEIMLTGPVEYIFDAEYKYKAD